MNELVDQKYPLEQVGNSYIMIPDGYANWSRTWPHNPQENTLNRLCVSVPLGTEGGLFSSRLGVPPVVCGPGSMAQGHKPYLIPGGASEHP